MESTLENEAGGTELETNKLFKIIFERLDNLEEQIIVVNVSFYDFRLN